MSKFTKNLKYYIPVLVFGFCVGSIITNFIPGIILSKNIWEYLKNLLLLLPPVFILIGLFEVWIPQSTIEKHFGESHGISAWLWLILLSTTIVGGLYVSLPLAYALWNKGTRMRLVFAFLGFSTICRIPMTFFEASFLGIKFTLIRYLIAIPLVILFSVILEKINRKPITPNPQNT